MATVLDIGLFEYFNYIFPTLFIFIVVYTILQKTKALSGEKIINFVIAFVAGIMVLMFKDVLAIINFMTPWFVMLFIFGILFILVFRVIGIGESTITDFVSKTPAVNWTIVVLVGIIAIAAIGHVFGQRWLPYTQGGINQTTAEPTGSTDSGDWSSNVMAVFFHPKILGLLVIFAIASVSVLLLGTKLA